MKSHVLHTVWYDIHGEAIRYRRNLTLITLGSERVSKSLFHLKVTKENRVTCSVYERLTRNYSSACISQEKSKDKKIIGALVLSASTVPLTANTPGQHAPRNLSRIKAVTIQNQRLLGFEICLFLESLTSIGLILEKVYPRWRFCGVCWPGVKMISK